MKIPGLNEFLDSKTSSLDFASFSGLSCTDSVVFDFWETPFDFAQPALGNTGALHDLGVFTVPNCAIESMGISSNPEGNEQIAAHVTALVEAMYQKIPTQGINTTIKENLATSLHFLFTEYRIERFVSMYFENWQPNCPIIHKPTFDVANVPLELLAVVVLFGAMYSQDELERYAARTLLDLGEILVFEADVFTYDTWFWHSAETIQNSPNTDHWSSFQKFQAGHLMVAIQYWAGAPLSKDRAMEIRFGEVIRVGQNALSANLKNLPLTICRRLHVGSA